LPWNEWREVRRVDHDRPFTSARAVLSSGNGETRSYHGVVIIRFGARSRTPAAA
jgi:hypothetical protein